MFSLGVVENAVLRREVRVREVGDWQEDSQIELT